MSFLHRLTHTHTHLARQDVAEVLLCCRRFPARMDLTVGLGGQSWHLRGVTLEGLSWLAGQNTRAGLTDALATLGAHRCADNH